MIYAYIATIDTRCYEIKKNTTKTWEILHLSLCTRPFHPWVLAPRKTSALLHGDIEPWAGEAAQIWCKHAPREGESVGVVGNIFITHLPTAHSMDSVLQNQRKSAAHGEPDIVAECLKLCGGAERFPHVPNWPRARNGSGSLATCAHDLYLYVI